ncbi:MAG TPA: hypothetical protein VMW36_00985 [Patescibacteria group bacterium]|nr:hypothetical protein [Patescibacteria group bacterium]
MRPMIVHLIRKESTWDFMYLRNPRIFEDRRKHKPLDTKKRSIKYPVEHFITWGKQVTLPPPPPPKKRFSKGLLVGTVLTIIVLIAILAFVFLPFINKPKPQVTLVNGHEGFQGLNYVYYVDVSVRNSGVDGWIKVYAEINGAGRYETQDKRVYVASGQTNSLQFVFDITLWGALSNPTVSYRAWANAD